MKKRHTFVALTLLLGSVTVAMPMISRAGVGISVTAVSIGFYQPAYPEFVLVPGYPVYYAPRVRANYFFYDGLYWLYHDDQWYSSAWYNGPWDLVEPDYVPLFVLRVPVRYYLAPPVYFHGWVVDAPPRWGHYWGPRWVRHRHGWDHWNHHAIPAPAPLPVYQRRYAGNHYPRAEQQRMLRDRHYHYQPREAVTRQYHQRPVTRGAQPGQQHGQPVPHAQPPQRQREHLQRAEPARAPPQQPGPTEQQLQGRQRQDQQQNRRAPETSERVRRENQSAPQARQPHVQRENIPRPVSIQAPRQQSAPQVPAQRYQPRQRTEPRAQPAPRQQVREERSQVRRESHQPRVNAGQQRPHERGRRHQ